MRTVHPLNDDWLFLAAYQEGLEQADADESAFVPARLPHTSRELPFNNFDERDSQLISCYRRRIRVAPRAGRRVFLHFEGVMAAAKVYYNGAPIAEHLGGYTPFTCELTGLVTGGDDMLAVVVDSHERADIPPFGYVIDYLTYGGIYREVWLEETNEVYLQNVHAIPRKSGGGWRVDLSVSLENGSGTPAKRKSPARSRARTARCARTVKAPRSPASGSNRSIFHSTRGIASLGHPRTEPVRPQGRAALGRCRAGRIRLPHRVSRGGVYAGRLFSQRRACQASRLNRHQSYPYVGNAMPKRAQSATRSCSNASSGSISRARATTRSRSIF